MKKILLIIYINLIGFNICLAEVKVYKSSQIPEKANPNYETLVDYYQKYQFDKYKFDRYESEISDNPFQFKFNLREEKYLDKQLKKTALLSYLLFENDNIVIDKISPNERFGKYINEE